MKKDVLALFLVILIIAVLIKGTNFQSVEEYYLTNIDDITKDSETVFISIDCSTILDNWDDLWPELKTEDFVPRDGEILGMTEYMYCVLGIRCLTYWNEPSGTIESRWNIRVRI